MANLRLKRFLIAALGALVCWSQFCFSAKAPDSLCPQIILKIASHLPQWTRILKRSHVPSGGVLYIEADRKDWPVVSKYIVESLLEEGRVALTLNLSFEPTDPLSNWRFQIEHQVLEKPAPNTQLIATLATGGEHLLGIDLHESLHAALNRGEPNALRKLTDLPLILLVHVDPSNADIASIRRHINVEISYGKNLFGWHSYLSIP